jgi:hypothetical protein
VFERSGDSAEVPFGVEEPYLSFTRDQIY